MSVRRKLFIVVLIPAVLFTLFAGGLLLSLQRLDVSRNNVSDCRTLSQSALELVLLTEDYLHGGETRAREQWWNLHKTLSLHTDNLAIAVAGEQHAKTRIKKNLDAVSELFDQLTAIPVEHSQYRKHLSAQITAQANAFASEADMLAQNCKKKAAHFEHLIWIFFFTAGALLLAGAFYSSYAIGNRIVQRLRTLEQTANAIEKGELDKQIKSAHRDEIGQLARTFDRMTAALHKELKRRLSAEESLREVNELLRSTQQVNQLIVRENNRQRLIDQVCSLLVRSRGFEAAWIALLNGGAPLLGTAQSTEGIDYTPLLEQIYSGSLPPCTADALKKRGIHKTVDHNTVCHNCPLEKAHQKFPVMAVRLEHGRNVYGVLAVYGKTAAAFEEKEGPVLFQELADDIGLALHKVTLEEERELLQSQLLQAQKMEAVGRLAGGIAHDFRNQLTVIGGYCDLILRILPPDSPLIDQLSEIQRASQRSEKLTTQLLAFSRKQLLRPHVIDINAILRDITKPIVSMLGEACELTMTLPETIKHIILDPVQLEQALLNLVANAGDAMPKGGRLTIETSNVDLDNTFLRTHPEVTPGPHVMLAISDTGTGMDSETLHRIFDPFFTTKEKEKGTGLGLSMVYSFVKQSGGSIFVYSKPGEGTTFKLYFPCSKTETVDEAQASPEIQQAEPHGTETILLVENNKPVRELARQILENCGYTLLTASNAEEAVSVSTEHAGGIDLLAADVVMPGESGPELADRLVKQRPEMKTMFISGHTGDAIDRHGLRKPDVDLLAKPFSPATLAQAVRRILDRPSANE